MPPLPSVPGGRVVTAPAQAGRCGECGRTEADHQAANPQLAAILNCLAGCYDGYKITSAEAHRPPAPPVGAHRRQFISPTGATPMPAPRNVTREIINLAQARRGEAFALGLQDAFGRAGAAGADYDWACRYACRLIFRDDSDPGELPGQAIALRQADGHLAAMTGQPAPASVQQDWAAEARQAMAEGRVAGQPATQNQEGAA